MGRLPFDPAKMAHQPAPAAAAAGSAPARAEGMLTVSQLAAKIDDALTRGVPGPIRVIGEVSGFRERTHWYFDLKDAESVVNAVMFASAARKAGFTPTVGQEVVATGRVEFYAKGGKVTLLIEKLEPVGAGALELAFRALCEELRGLGWFAPERKRALPAFPRRVAVVTSKTGAALQDVLATMNKRCPAVGVLVVDVRVQGERAAPEVAEAIGYLSANATALGIDAILVTRGGGSMEDLWAFNERVVAEAIVHCAVPVVAAIGHETDTTIAELVADERAATPTQAAMRLTPDRAALLRQVEALRRRLGADVARRLQLGRERVRGVARHPFLTRPGVIVDDARERAKAARERLRAATRGRFASEHVRLHRLAARLERGRPAAVHAGMRARAEALATRLRLAMRARLDGREIEALSARLSRGGALALRETRARLESAQRQLLAVGPQSVLDRGFSCTLGESGHAVRSADEVRAGERLRTILARGAIRSVVEGGGSPPAPRPVPRTTPKARRLARPGGDGQAGLFEA